jgi:hypothetical protein
MDDERTIDDLRMDDETTIAPRMTSGESKTRRNVLEHHHLPSSHWPHLRRDDEKTIAPVQSKDDVYRELKHVSVSPSIMS